MVRARVTRRIYIEVTCELPECSVAETEWNGEILTITIRAGVTRRDCGIALASRLSPEERIHLRVIFGLNPNLEMDAFADTGIDPDEPITTMIIPPEFRLAA